jgi:plasmid stabilization system protein ParE
MSSYQFTSQALDDLFDIWSYIAGDDLDAANRVEEAIHAACAFLADSPLAGRTREDLTALPVRFWLVCTDPPRLPSQDFFVLEETVNSKRGALWAGLL